MLSLLNEQGDSPLSHTDIGLDDQRLLKIYRTMLLTRIVDERMILLQRQGLITFSLSSLGEEACAVATSAALTLDDWLYPQYREVGALFFRGFSVEQYLHQMFGNALDLNRGRQMPNHFGSRELNVVTVSSPIGTNIPQAAGAAYAMKIAREKAVAVAFFGEGATSEGDFHTGLNFAAVKRVPALFFCRNNGYAISTPASCQFASDGIAPKGVGYGIYAVAIDGNDVFAIYDTVKKAKERCLKGEGPVLIEAITYRMGAHSTSDDPSRYRSSKEPLSWAEKCPLLRLKRYAEKRGLLDAAQEEAMLKKIEEELAAAIEKAKAAPPPPLHSLIEDVYSDVPPKLEEEFKEWLSP